MAERQDMYHIESIEVDGFWGSRSLTVDFHDDVNIIIGKNGTGKTTLINILQAALSVDVSLLASLSFDQIRLRLLTDSSTRTVSITREPSKSFYDLVKYKISRKKFTFPLFPSEVDYRRRLKAEYLSDYQEARSEMASLVNTSWLSVGREILEDDDWDPRLRRKRPDLVLNPVDIRLNALLKRLSDYQLRLQTRAGALSARFQEQVLTSILFRPEFDAFDVDEDLQEDFDSLKEQLVEAYGALGMQSSQVNARIRKHITEVKKSYKTILRKKASKEGFYINEVLPISLLKRTQHIVGLSTDTQMQRRQLFSHIDLFVDTVNSFFEDKLARLGSSDESGLEILKDASPIPFAQLSSGEKQLFILLTETLLQNQQSSVFIADEPELSLHIEWQRQLVTAIRRLNPRSQLIAATHSPEIAGPWKSNIIQMRGVLSDAG